MALPSKIDSFAKIIATLPDKPVETLGSAAALKAYFDSSPEELRLKVNALIDALNATADGGSGADSIGFTAISTSPATVQGAVEWLHAQLSGIVLDQVPDGSITESKLSATAADAFKNMTDQDTGTKYRWAIKSGVIGMVEVE